MRVTIEQDHSVVVDIATRAAANINAGLGEGIRHAAREMADDVAAHTPKRSGRAGAAVQVLAHRYVEHGQVIMHDFREAFYMRFVLRGAKAHRIYPKYQSTRGLKYARKRAANKGISFEGGPKKSLAYTKAGGLKVFAAEVDHPGVKGRDILGERLAANKERSLQLIYDAIERQMNRRR